MTMPSLSTPSVRPCAALCSWVLSMLLAACSLSQPGGTRGDLSGLASEGVPASAGPAFRRGVNFGNMLEAPSEGAWGLTVQERFFDRAVAAGLDHIRLPVSWTHHAGAAPPYTIDPVFLARVVWCVDQAQSRGLGVILNTHHYDELNADPIGERPRALAIWEQIALAFEGRPAGLRFEVLNEPHGVFNDQPALWDAYVAEALAVIRARHPGRPVLAGPVRWNAVSALASFNPPSDPALIVTVHHYEPFGFTHQGATWIDPVPPVGVAWDGERFGFADPWQDWSWSTQTQGTASGLAVSFAQGWAGLQFRRAGAVADATRLRFTLDRALQPGERLNVIVGSDAGEVQVQIVPQPGVFEHAIDLSAGLPVDRVIVQNATPDPRPVFTLSSVALETAGGGSVPLLMTERQAVEAAMAFAAAWGASRGLPVNLGEFGAFSTADMASRARWTRAVRDAAEANGIGWTYWELAAGFGFYDPDADAWRLPLLEALVGE